MRGQCTPPAPAGQPGISPGWRSLHCAERGTEYNTIITFENFDSIGGLYVSAFAWDSIVGLPAGLIHSLNPISQPMQSGQAGCIKLSGTTSDTAGSYKVNFYVTITLSNASVYSGKLEDLVNQFLQTGMIDSTDLGFYEFDDEFNDYYTYYFRVVEKSEDCEVCSWWGHMPDVEFWYDQSNSPVVFNGYSRYNATSWFWDFGDGTTSTLEDPTHAFAPGNYRTCLIVTTFCGSLQHCQNLAIGEVGIWNTDFLNTLTIYPNPFTEVATIEIPEVVNGTFDLRVLDLLGNEVRLLQNLTDKTIQLQRDNLANGVYFIEVRCDRRYFGKVVLK